MMNRANAVAVGIATIAVGLAGVGCAVARPQEFDQEKIKDEVMAHLRLFAGPVADQSVELWDQYFLRSPNIGNKHGSDVEIGWEAFHQGNISFFATPGIDGGSFGVEDLRVYPINENVAWVRGLFLSRFGGSTEASVFYDTLVRTGEGWRVVLSYVEPPSRKGEGVGRSPG